MSRKKLAIVGNGMATCRLLDELIARDSQSLYETTVFGEEPGGAYNRILLSRVLGGEEPDAIVTKTPDWYDRHGARLVSGTAVKRLDTLRKILETADGQSRAYDAVVLATGSQPLVPGIHGLLDEQELLKPGAFVYRTMADCLSMRSFARPGDSAVVLGGGLLGLEAAKVLADRGLHVTVVHVARTLMNAQLDASGGEMLARQIEGAGLFVRNGRQIETVYGADRVRGVILDDGTNLPADLIVVACGVRPRVDVAVASGLPVNKGIVVNDTLATAVPGVYALGECAEHRGRTYGIVGPVWEQAAVLADVLTGGASQSRYRGSKLYTRLKVAGVDVAAMGVLEPALESDQVIQVVEERRCAYRKLIIRDRQLIGAMLVGNTTAAATLIQMFDRADPMPEDPLAALCAPRSGVTAGDRQICNCNKVNESTLRDAIAAGADSVAALGEATRAGTNCGSCKNDLAQLLATTRKPEAPLEAAVS